MSIYRDPDEEDCSTCEGTGEDPNDEDGFPCPDCEGSGVNPDSITIEEEEGAMTKADQIAAIVKHILSDELDYLPHSDYEALAADYEARGEEIERLQADIIEGGMLRKRVGDDLGAAYDENEILTTELRRLELAHATDLGTIAKLQVEIERLKAIATESINRERESLTTIDEFLVYVREVEDREGRLKAENEAIKADIARCVKRTEYADSAISATIYESQSGIRTPQEAIRKIGLILFGTGVEVPNVKGE